jgi:hypothetical protein
VLPLVVLALSLFRTTPAVAADDGKRAEWVQKHEDLTAHYAKAQADLAEARAAYSRGRSNRYLRGEGKTGLVADINRLEQEVAQAQRDLESFPDEARRAGALPGWFRDDSPAAPAADGAKTVQPRSGSESLSQRNARARQVQSEPAETAESDTSDQQEDSATRKTLRDRRASDRDSRRLP